MRDSKLNTPSELLLHRTLCKTNRLALPSRFYIRGWFLTCCLQMLRNRHRGRRRLPERVWDPPRDLEGPVWLSATSISSSGKLGHWSLLLLAARFTRDGGNRQSPTRGLWASGYIKVKVLRTEISKLQGKSAWSLKTLPLKSQCWYDSQQKESPPPQLKLETGTQRGTQIHVHSGSGGQGHLPEPSTTRTRSPVCSVKIKKTRGWKWCRRTAPGCCVWGSHS